MKNMVENEKQTVKIMIQFYCNKKHNTRRKLCDGCKNLLEYIFDRLNKCKFGNNKGPCSKCEVHCYKPEMRKKIIEVMRFSGPRIVFIHPVLAVRHFLGRFHTRVS